MSHPEREAPAVRPRRRVNPPAYLEDFELSGPGSHRQQSRSLTSQGELEDEPASTTGHSRSTSPLSQASDHSQWILADQWDSITERLREENAALQRQVEQLPELTAMMEEMKRENAALQRQASQLPEIISARKSPPKPVTPPMPSPHSYSRAVNIQTPQLYCPIPAPRSRLPPPVTKRQPCPAVTGESSELTEDLRNMNISSSSHERPHFSAQYSNLPQLKYPDRSLYSLPRQLPEFMVPTQDQRRPAYAEYSSDHLLPSSTQEKIYRGPGPYHPLPDISRP
ncbi:hypothetical protein M9458_034126 [Cirrhinus mrigala]|uniref:Uncharacterized protein n=1 Tax=Cirrhinus mrigala TaxID=683832 RepID=A0ABD0P6K8_CIRMR